MTAEARARRTWQELCSDPSLWGPADDGHPVWSHKPTLRKLQALARQWAERLHAGDRIPALHVLPEYAEPWGFVAMSFVWTAAGHIAGYALTPEREDHLPIEEETEKNRRTAHAALEVLDCLRSDRDFELAYAKPDIPDPGTQLLDYALWHTDWYRGDRSPHHPDIVAAIRVLLKAVQRGEAYEKARAQRVKDQKVLLKMAPPNEAYLTNVALLLWKGPLGPRQRGGPAISKDLVRLLADLRELVGIEKRGRRKVGNEQLEKMLRDHEKNAKRRAELDRHRRQL
jgi:hypothetical protein